MSSPAAVKDYLRLQIGLLEHEVFCGVFLDARYRLIALKEIFRGTVTQTSVYPRKVVKESLALNAAAVIRVDLDSVGPASGIDVTRHRCAVGSAGGFRNAGQANWSSILPARRRTGPTTILTS